jgi:hypothetical protein
MSNPAVSTHLSPTFQSAILFPPGDYCRVATPVKIPKNSNFINIYNEIEVGITVA